MFSKIFVSKFTIYPQGYISYYYTGLANNPLSSHNMNATFIRFTHHMIRWTHKFKFIYMAYCVSLLQDIHSILLYSTPQLPYAWININYADVYTCCISASHTLTSSRTLLRKLFVTCASIVKRYIQFIMYNTWYIIYLY